MMVEKLHKLKIYQLLLKIKLVSSSYSGMIEEKKVIRQLILGKEHVKIVVQWDIKENNAQKDQEKYQLNSINKILLLMM